MLIRILTLFSTLIFLSGCATGPQPMAPEAADKFRTGNIAVAYNYPEKSINYSEDVYKVLWIEKRGNGVSFDGLWNIDKDLSEFYSQKFEQQGLKSQSIFSSLNPEQSQRLYNEMQISRDENGAITSILIDDASRQALQQDNKDFLVIFYQAPVHLQVHAWFNNIFVQSATKVVVLDLKDGSEKYSTFEYLFHTHKYQEQPREIESNNLAGFKDMIKASIEKQFHEKRLASQLNL